jgi:hypothetical protein
MDRKLARMTLAGTLAIAGLAHGAALFPYEGEWTLNVAESKYPPGFPAIRDHHMQVTKDDGTILQYTDNFQVDDQPPVHVSYDGAYDGKPHKTSDGQMMAVFHTKTGYRDQYTAPNGAKGKDKCDFSADGMRMTCYGEFTPPDAKQPVKFLEIWDKTK